MKNHFSRTGLSPAMADDDVPSALAHVRAHEGSELAEDVHAARDALDRPERRVQYRRTHYQYRALAEAMDALEHPTATDSHRWRERLVEFTEDDQSMS